MRRKRFNKNLIVCPKTKQFTNLIVCAASCQDRCQIYRDSITMEALLEFVEKHPEYKLKGELMPAKKIAEPKEKKFWIVGSDKKITEVSEKEIMDNPQEYLKKKIWDKPTYKYEVIITLKRIKA